MTIYENQSLKPYNTFKVDVSCKSLVNIYSIHDVFKFLALEESNFMVIGGGSNLLFRKNYDGFILRNLIKGVEIIDEDDESALVKVGAGEIWHNFVLWCVSHKLWGLENLSLIPGSVGAAPIQNIGAYGVEQNSCFHSLNAISIENGTNQTFYNADCKFGYRDSIFKNSAKGQYIITHVTYLLSKKPNPVLNYADVAQRVGEVNKENIKAISDTIIDIRRSKLPDPEEVGNAGSFFKNPVIDKDKFDKLAELFPNISSYPSGDKIKIAAAWLIDQCGFKGKTVGNTGSYKNQALVIVNHGNATGEEIYNYAVDVQNAVKNKFDIELEMEVNIV